MFLLYISCYIPAYLKYIYQYKWQLIEVLNFGYNFTSTCTCGGPRQFITCNSMEYDQIISYYVQSLNSPFVNFLRNSHTEGAQ
jgi:hypothetical protein